MTQRAGSGYDTLFAYRVSHSSMNEITSPPAPNVRLTPAPIAVGRNCWRVEQVSRASIIVDADDYFEAARQAMLSAKHRIMLIGWDFDARIKFGHPESSDDGPQMLGLFVLWMIECRTELQLLLLWMV